MAVLASCSSVRERETAVPRAAGAATQVLYVVRRGWHVDVGFSREALSPPLEAAVAESPQSRFVLFGFGDRRYLLARHKSLDGLMAILHSGPALLLVSGLDLSPKQAFPEAGVVELHVTKAQMAAAQSAVVSSFSVVEPAAVAPGPYDESRYFAAGPRYSAVHTCNTWAAEILKAAGLPIRSTGTLFASQLWLQVKSLQ